jgi:hypothetical protein
MIQKVLGGSNVVPQSWRAWDKLEMIDARVSKFKMKWNMQKF